MTRAVAILLSLFAAGACAYYNGVYNARGLVRRADSATRDGRDSAAAAAWREAAAKADTVVQRYPRSRWTDDALLLGGMASALAGDCAHGLERLVQWQRHPTADLRHRARASLARGVCLVRLGQPAPALDTLAPLVAYRDAAIARLAAGWAARAALATNRGDSAVILAHQARSDALDAELAIAALASSRRTVAMDLMRRHAADWRSLSAMHAPLATLAREDIEGADSIVQLVQQGRASRLDRARLSVAAGVWCERYGDAKRARKHYEGALRTTADTTLVAEVMTRLAMLDVRGAPTIDAARELLARARGKAAQSPELAHADTALRLAGRLTSTTDTTGASLFLAAEVARDAVGANALARTLFLRAAREHRRSSLAPKALLAAADLSPDSAATWRAMVRMHYGESPYAHLLDGKPVASASLEQDERLLRQTWSRATGGLDSASVVTERRRP